MNSIDEVILAKKDYTYRIVTNKPGEGIIRTVTRNQPGLPADKIFEYADMANWNTPMDGDEVFRFKEEAGVQHGKEFKASTTYVSEPRYISTNWQDTLKNYNNNNH